MALRACDQSLKGKCSQGGLAASSIAVERSVGSIAFLSPALRHHARLEVLRDSARTAGRIDYRDWGWVSNTHTPRLLGLPPPPLRVPP
jgi:hypothetical protein